MKKELLITISGFFFLCLLWEMVSRYFVSFHFILPPLSTIFKRIWHQPDLFFFHTKVTLFEMIAGFMLALAIAFPLAWMMYLWQSSRAIFQSFFVIFQSVPMFVLAPLMVFWFGWSYTAIVIPTALMIFFPLTMNIYQGLSSTPKELLSYFKIYRATRWQLFTKLQLPWSLPHVFAGFKISAALAGIGAIAGEWAGAQSGLGMLMLQSRRETDLETTFGAIFCLMFMSIVLYAMVSYAEQRYKKQQSLKAYAWITLVFFSSILLFTTTAPRENFFAYQQPFRLLLDWYPNSNHVPIYVGLEKKIFVKYQMDLQILSIHDTSDAIPYLTTGRADVALYYMPDALLAMKKNNELTFAGVLIDHPLNSFIFRSEDEITSPKDLSGKVIGYSVAGSNLNALKQMLKQNYIVPKEMRNISFDLTGLLRNQQVDVIYGAFWNIEKNHLRSLNVSTNHFEVSQLGHPMYSELIFLGSGVREKFEVFKLAVQESIDFCKKYPSESFEIYKRCHPAKSESTLIWEEQAWKETVALLAQDQEISQEQTDSLQKWLEEME